MSEVLPEKEKKPSAVSAYITNLRETQAILAYIMTLGFLSVAAFAITKAANFQDIGTVMNTLAPLATMVLAFFFANKAARQTQTPETA